VTQPLLEAFQVLYEAEDLPSHLMPFDLERVYGGIGFGPETLYSNFVTSIDGVATLGEGNNAGSLISGKYPADRFLMALLRACADGVLIGAGTLRSTPGHVWTAGHVYPQAADSFAALRRSLGKPKDPQLAVITGSGDIDVAHPALQRGAIVITTTAGKAALKDRIPKTCEVVSLPGKRVDVTQATQELRSRGLAVILTEGGPGLMGQLVEARLLDEAFITMSPVVAGREPGTGRLGMVEGVEFQPAQGPWFRLLSMRRHGDYLFSRYALKRD